MGLPEATIRKWLATLRKCGYVDTKNTGRCSEIVIKKWKTLGGCADASIQNATTGGNRLPQNGRSHGMWKTENTFEPEEKTSGERTANDITIKRKNNNDKIDDVRFSKSGSSMSRKTFFAQELAESLGDPAGLPFYLACTKRYPEDFLRVVLAKVQEIPDEEIKRARGALFNHLVNEYGSPPGTAQI